MASKAIPPDTVSAMNAIDRITQKMMVTLGDLRHAIEAPDRSPFCDTAHRVGLVIQAANDLDLLSDFARLKIRQQGEKR
jgi:hypothetical protein